MPKKEFLSIVLLSLLAISAECQTVIQQPHNLQSEDSSQSVAHYVSSAGADDPTQHPLFITLVVLLAFNFVILLLICCCRGQMTFPIDFSQPKRENDRYLHIANFQTNSYCLTEGETFPRHKCFEMTDTLTELPAFIYSREIQAEVNNVGFLVIKQCDHCRGMTSSIEILKYGKLKECWATLFMIVISPCFLAFTIRMFISNNILWSKLFCGECGREKRKQSKM